MLAISIKSIFSDHWKSIKLELSRRHESSHWQSIVESVEKMLSCKEPSSGYAEYICTHCGIKKKCPFTCKGRFCTSCGKRYTDEWVQRTVEELIDVPHRHLVFTIAEELREVLFWHRSLLKVMMDCAAQTALEVLQSQKSEAVPRDFGGGAHLWAGPEVQPSCSSSDDGRGVERGAMGAHSFFALCAVAEEVAVSFVDGD